MFEIDVPLSVVAGGVATSILDLSVPDGVLGDIAIVCAQVVPLVAITHLVAMLQRVFTASVGQLQQALRVSHRRFWSAMAVHGALSIVCFIVGAYAGPSVALSSPPPASAGALCGAALFAINVLALLYVAFTVSIVMCRQTNRSNGLFWWFSFNIVSCRRFRS
jgi:hypothetical protein